MTEDFASRIAMRIRCLTPQQEGQVADVLRGERRRAVTLCETWPIPQQPGSISKARTAWLVGKTAWSVGVADARRDIATAIRGE